MTEFENFTDTAANRQRPTVVAGSQPVRRNYRRSGHVPAVREVVINERLNEQCVDVVFSPSRK